ncbi:hypothetical protein AXX04_13545 [Pseudomonas aeruginosa]|uniref:hypothetical protein n=1 Tax=Pseudomonas aeruginosa TaxID=287 RepID=UPI000EC0AD52|nr:hypothetical protein [Pseudomonas aeruginosa]RIZ44654.1 hypothetical protein AXX04_13545 [Pseudomonas aeruginosa]
MTRSNAPLVQSEAGKCLAAQAEQAEAERPEMSSERAAYFMRRFKSEEKLLGPNEQAAVDYVLSLIAQHERIVGALRAVIAQLRQHKNDYMDSGQQTYRALQNEIREREAEIARLDGLVSGRTAERDAALAEVERLTRDRDDCLKARLHYATQHGLSLARLAELTATRNRYGVDAHYFNKNLQRILRDFESFTPDELARSLIILAKVADEKVVAQAQHSVPEGVRELLEMLVASDLRKIRYAGAWRREVHDRASSILALLAAAPGKEGV